jgi:hypothetical protein
MSAKATETKYVKTAVPDEERCLFTTRNGNRCKNPHLGTAGRHCILHEGRCQKVDLAEVRAVADQLFSDCAKLETRSEVNRFTAQLLTLVAQKRISREDGSLLAYIASLLLQTIAPAERSKPIAYDREELMASFASPIHDGRTAIDRNVAEPMPATREEFNRRVAERFAKEPQMPGRSYNPYTYPSITHKR